MPSRTRSPRREPLGGARTALGRAGAWIRRHWHRLRPQESVEVLTVDARSRTRVVRTLRCGLRRLRRALGDTFPPGLMVLAQDTLTSPAPALTARRGGHVIVRLALRSGDRRLDADELLAALADAVLGLGAVGDDGPGRAADLSVGLLADPLAA